MNVTDIINITMNIVGAVVCLLIIFFGATSESGKEKRSRIFIWIVIIQVVVILLIILENMLDINVIPGNTYIKYTVLMLIPLCGSTMLIFFTALILTILREKTVVSKTAVWAAYIAAVSCIADIIITIITRSVVIYRAEAASYYQMLGGLNNWFLFSQSLSLVCIAIGMGLLIAYKKFMSRRELFTLLSYGVLPIVAIVIELYFWRLALVCFSITLAIIIYYASIQSELSQQIKQKELEITKNKISIMLSQIQPHFLHNALTAVAQLCDEDSAKAKKATIDFSTYLRNNMESLSGKDLISIEKEINHVRAYLDLEKVIYGDALTVVFHIHAGGFLLPPLSIQPIVENAVKHGIGKKEGGGTITVSIHEDNGGYLIKVADDGAGYDIANPQRDGRDHVGIENVRQRIKEQCGGTLEISSEIERGTNVVIRIPKL
jgi:sensor histidine kinase YesM